MAPFFSTGGGGGDSANATSSADGSGCDGGGAPAASSTSSSSSALPPLHYTVKVVLVGDSGVGKTSIAVRYVRNEFQPYREPTIGAAFLSKTQEIIVTTTSSGDGDDRGEGPAPATTSTPRLCQRRKKFVRMKIWDTAGQERYHSLTPLYFRGAGACVLVYDVCRLHSFQALSKWVREIRHFNARHQQQYHHQEVYSTGGGGNDDNNDAGGDDNNNLNRRCHDQSTMVLIIVGNKSDLDSERSVRRVDAEVFAREHDAYYIETSAKSGTNIEELFVELAKRASDVLEPDPPPHQQQLGNDYGGGDGRIDLSAASRSYSSATCCSSSNRLPEPTTTTILE